MKILVVGAGGREHALCWAIAKSPLCDALYCAPGNGGIARHATCVAIGSDAIDALVAFCQTESIDFVVVGPEAPLVAGLADRLEDAGIETFGPSAQAAQLEGSKAFTKQLCQRHGIATAAFAQFTDVEAAKAHVRDHGAPLVVKADGLAAGKGVTVAHTIDEALAALDTIAAGAFGEVGATGAAAASIVIEDFVDGETALALVGAQDHKAVGEGDTGPNTGGMGAYSPAPILDEAMAARVMRDIIEPTVRGMAAEGMAFKGVLYAGLMITDTGPQLLEYNVRFGDPECQVLMARLKSDILPALMAARDGELAHFDLRWRDEPALCVVMASKGYPGSYEKGTPIKGLAALEAEDSDGDLVVFHAGTATDGADYVATGGRVLGITARGTTVAEAQKRAYAAVDRIDWPAGFCRRDIAWRAVGG
jgi:phosphoribosylamine--glycine ligase